VSDLLNKLVLDLFNLDLNVGNLLLDGGGLLANLLGLDSLGLNLILDERDSLFGLLGDARGLLLLELGLVDLGNLGGSHGLLLLLSEDLCGFFDKNLLFLSLRFFDGGPLNLNFTDQLRRLNLEALALLEILLLLGWVVRFLSIHAILLALDLLVFGNNLLLLVDLLLLGIFLSDDSLLFLDFSGDGRLGVRSALFVTDLAAGSCRVGFSILDVGDERDGLGVLSLVPGGLGGFLGDGCDLSLCARVHGLFGPVVHDCCDGLWGSEGLSVIAEALLGSAGRWVGVLEGLGRAADWTAAGGISDGESGLKDVIEVGKPLVAVDFGSEVDVAIASAVIAFFGTSRCLIGWLDLAIALLVESWHWVAAKIDGIARLPVIGLLGDGLPLSHFVESLDWAFGVWASSDTKPHGSWALAALVCLGGALEWLVVLVNDRIGVDGVLVASSLPVLLGLHERGGTISAKHAGNFGILVQISLGLVVGQSLGAGTESTLLETGGSVVALWVQQSVDILVASRVASGVIIVESAIGGWTSGRCIDVGLDWLRLEGPQGGCFVSILQVFLRFGIILGVDLSQVLNGVLLHQGDACVALRSSSRKREAAEESGQNC